MSRPRPVRPRGPTPQRSGFAGRIQPILLRVLDGAACELTRRRLVLAGYTTDPACRPTSPDAASRATAPSEGLDRQTPSRTRASTDSRLPPATSFGLSTCATSSAGCLDGARGRAALSSRPAAGASPRSGECLSCHSDWCSGVPVVRDAASPGGVLRRDRAQARARAQR